MKIDKQFLLKVVLIFYSLSVALELHFFYNSISTLIRCLFITLIFLIIFFKYSTKKERKYLYLYFCVYLVYIILHLLNINNNSIIAEILYFYKMSMSVLTIYTTYKLGLNLDKFYKTLSICVFLIAGSIVLSNIMGIGYSSYNFNKMSCSIFTWFNDSCNQAFIGTKGFFHFANQIIAILVMYLPLLIYFLKEKLSIFNLVNIVLCLLALLMLGNRIATIVPLIIIAVSFIAYIFFIIIKKEKSNFYFLVTLFTLGALYTFLIFYSPLIRRANYYKGLLEGVQVDNLISGDPEENHPIPDYTEEELEILDGHNVNFLVWYYPYSGDRDFWNELLEKYDDSILMDGRFIEKKVAQRIVELNNNMPYDRLLGIGYDRIINIQNVEQDFIMQYYTLGIVGSIIILGVYIMLYLYFIWKILINLQDNFNYKIVMLMFSTGLFLVSSYYGGNLLNSISAIIPFCFIIGITLNEVNIPKKKESRVLGFNVCSKSKDDILDGIKKDLKNNKQNIIYNINPLIVMNFYKDKKVISQFNKQSFNIPDGIGTVAALKMKSMPESGRIAGIDLFENLLHLASENKYKVYLYGAKKGIAKKASEKIKENNPKINIVGISDGYQDEKNVLKDISKTKPDMLFVATGSPKQELFIFNNQDKFKMIKLIMPVGGSFDVLSGNVKRAPKVWERIHLEWLYRMIKEPKRIKNNLSLIKYVFLVIFKNY